MRLGRMIQRTVVADDGELKLHDTLMSMYAYTARMTIYSIHIRLFIVPHASGVVGCGGIAWITRPASTTSQ